MKNPFNWFNRPKIQQIIVNQSAPPEDINEQLDEHPIDRIRQQLSDWGESVKLAEYIHLPQRWNLLDLYHNIVIDEHVTALTDTIQYRVTQTPFQIVDKNGNEKEETKKLFEKSWFYDFVCFALEADYWGFSLIQFNELIDGVFSDVDNVNRYHIRPEKSGVSKDKFQTEPDIFYNKKPYEDWTIFLESKIHLGRFNNIAKKFILKREVNQFWAVYNELFTTPYFWVKTDMANKKHRKDLQSWLQNRKHSGYAIVGLEEEIGAISNGGQGYKSYEDFENNANNAMTKAFLGQTMVMEDGSSRSQAEVHERQMYAFIESRRVWLSYVINEQLIPMMNNLGIEISKDDKFMWVPKEFLTVKEYAEIISTLAPHFDFDENEISEKIDFTVTTKETPEMEKAENLDKNIKKTQNRLASIYNQSK